MSVPKRRKTSSKTKMGRSHQALKKITLTTCPKCKTKHRPHQACKNCGYYKGKQIIRTREEKKLAQKTKKDKREKEAMKSTK